MWSTSIDALALRLGNFIKAVSKPQDKVYILMLARTLKFNDLCTFEKSIFTLSMVLSFTIFVGAGEMCRPLSICGSSSKKHSRDPFSYLACYEYF